MFAFRHKAPPAPVETLESRIRAAVGHIPTAGHVLIVLQLDNDHARNTLVIHSSHGYLVLLCEPNPDAFSADCFRVDGNELHDEPHGLSIWPIHNDDFMRQFRGKPRAVVSYYGD